MPDPSDTKKRALAFVGPALQVDQLSEWEAILNRVGWPVLIIFAFGYIAVRVGRWLAPRIDKLVDAHLGFVESLKGELKSIDGKVSQTNEKLDDLTSRLAPHSNPPARRGRQE